MRPLLPILLVALGACGRLDYVARPDGGTATIDGGSLDGGALDAGARDAATIDGASIDGATIDAGMIDGATIDGGTGDECATRFATARLCSDFEDPLDAFWNTGSAFGNIALTTSQAHGGASSLLAQVTNGSGYARVSGGFDPVEDDLWLRAFFRIPDPAAIADVNVLAVDHAGGSAFGVDLNVGTDGTLELYIPEAGSFPADDAVRVPADAWFCVQLHVRVSDTDGRVELFVDGTRHIDALGIDTYPDGAYDRVSLGLDWTDPSQSAVDVLVDDVVIDFAPIPCE